MGSLSKPKIIVAGALILISASCAATFETLSDLIAYANSHEKYPDSNLDTQGKVAQLYPNFTNFYQKLAPGWFERIRCYFNIFKPAWCFSDFTKRLQKFYDLESERPWNKALIQQSDSTEKSIVGVVIGYKPAENTRLIVVGELGGSFHGLTSIIQHWYDTGIMNETLNIKDPDLKIIFLGNIVGSSAYDLEALMVVSTIAQRNPNQVYVLCGSSEDRQRWHESPLYQSIQIRSCLSRDKVRDIYTLIDNIFALLPDTFILTTGDKKTAIVFSAAQVFDNVNLSELFACLPEVSNTTMQGCPLYGHAKIGDKPTLLALVETRRTWNTIHVTAPLEKKELPTITGPVWDLISGASRAFRSIYRIRWNGYVVIVVQGESLEKSTIEYIGKRIEGQSDFSSRVKYNLITGEELSEAEAHPVTQNTMSKTSGQE